MSSSRDNWRSKLPPGVEIKEIVMLKVRITDTDHSHFATICDVMTGEGFTLSANGYSYRIFDSNESDRETKQIWMEFIR